MVDFSSGPVLYGTIGGGAVLLVILLVCCCCRGVKRKDDELCLTPTATYPDTMSKHHYVLDVDAVRLTSPAGAHAHLPRKSLTGTDTEGLAPIRTSPLSYEARMSSVARDSSHLPRTSLMTTDMEEYLPSVTSPPFREARMSSIARDPELFGTMRASTPPTPTSAPQSRKSSSNDDRGSERGEELYPRQPPNREIPLLKEVTLILEGDSLTEPFQVHEPESENGSEPDALEVIPTSPIEPKSSSRGERKSFQRKETEVVTATLTSPAERVSRRSMLAAIDVGRSRAVPTSPIRPGLRLSKTLIETHSKTKVSSPTCRTPRRHLTPKRKKSVTFDMPELDSPKPSSQPTTPRRASRDSILATSRFSRPLDPLAIAEDPVVVASRLPFETIRTFERIGQDGFGEVYRGSYRDSVVAIKRLLPDTRRDVNKIHSLFQEVKLMSTMNHAHIVHFIGVAWDSFSDVCVVTEFMEGGDLRAALDHFDRLGRPLGFDKQKATIALHVAHALTYLHSLQRTVLYRDFKSKNIYLNADQTLAKLTSSSVSKEWQDGTMSAGVGTVLWMAPEVMVGEKYNDKADVYSFGIVLSELDTYLLPYADLLSTKSDVDDDATTAPMTSTVLLHRILAGKASVTFSSQLRADVRALGEACIRLDPTERPTSAEVLYELQKIERTMESEISIVL